MLLTITTTHVPATDLGYLLAKNPDKVQTYGLSHGQAHVYYPVATNERCTAALLLDIDPVGLVRGRPQGDVGTLAQYVNDRPYVASSFLSVAIAQVLGSALAGRSRERQELADTPIALEAEIQALPCRGGEALLRRLFEPLGYTLCARRVELDREFPEWGNSPYFCVSLSATLRVQELLSHLYVLLPVLDDDKHYWVGDDEVDKLLAKGEGWLATHPEKEQIALRYLKRRRHLAERALERLVGEEGVEAVLQEEEHSQQEEVLERGSSLNEVRVDRVGRELRAHGASSVIDLGCGEGKLLRRLVRDPQLSRIAGADVSLRALEIASTRLGLEQLPKRQQERVQLFQAALSYRDERFAGFDAATLIEVIEHVEPSRLEALEHVVFGFARPRCVIVTTPNAEYNVRFEGLCPGKFRHSDHRFEWTRAQFAAWVARVRERFGYGAQIKPIGSLDPELGAPTQMAIFSRHEPSAGGAMV